ncbi:hypothetical protein JOQ06_004077 [Pogonophryne albipinna]|uniref:Uncharacterized protein n=1 Tax=Pogonophryne albipinna TaxID=1090488 RepID=A0AAD6AE53_9TELE|nr:hypothetical protein JOQ06_004077 [Pogonophryne albipinna]
MVGSLSHFKLQSAVWKRGRRCNACPLKTICPRQIPSSHIKHSTSDTKQLCKHPSFNVSVESNDSSGQKKPLNLVIVHDVPAHHGHSPVCGYSEEAVAGGDVPFLRQLPAVTWASSIMAASSHREL